MSAITYMDSGRKYLVELTLVNGRKVRFNEYDHKIYNNIINREIEGHYFISLKDINGNQVFVNLKQCVSFDFIDEVQE